DSRRVKTRPTRLRLRLRLPLPLPLILTLTLTLTFGAPPERRSRRTRPRRGAAQGCAAFSAEAGCLLGKSRRLRGPGAQHRARRPGCAFFAPGFFAQAKKGGSGRHGAKALELDIGGTGTAGGSRPALRGCLPLLSPRKSKSGSLRSHPHPPSGHLLPQAGEGLKLYRTRRRGVLSLRQVSLHKQSKVARAVTARKLLILMSAKERRVKTRPTRLRQNSRRVKTRPTRLPLLSPQEEQERLAALAPSSALRAPSPACGRRAV